MKMVLIVIMVIMVIIVIIVIKVIIVILVIMALMLKIYIYWHKCSKSQKWPGHLVEVEYLSGLTRGK